MNFEIFDFGFSLNCLMQNRIEITKITPSIASPKRLVMLNKEVFFAISIISKDALFVPKTEIIAGSKIIMLAQIAIK